MPLYDLTTRKTKDTAGDLQLEDFNDTIRESLKKYSRARPRTLVADVAGDGSHDYPLPAGWSNGLSALQSIEFPIGSLPETYIDNDGIKLYQAPGGVKIRLYDFTPAVGETIRVTFTGLHDETSLPDADIEAVANMAASLCCRQLALRYAGSSDSTIGADVVNYRSKGDEFARRAKELEKLFRDAIGIRENDTTPAAMATVAAPDSRRRLTHG